MFIAVILIYFMLLLGVSRLTASRSNNNIFFRGARQSPWYLVAFGMIGASISGITFVSVPGMVIGAGMSYLYTCLGFIFGYFVVAFVLLPAYYRLNLTTIYSVLKPLGAEAYKTGAAFFLLSKMTGAAARFYVPCYIIYQSLWGMTQTTAAEGGNASVTSNFFFLLTVCVMVALIWAYTRRGGIKTLVWTDTMQTFCMFAALLLIIYNVSCLLCPEASGIDSVMKSFVAVFHQDVVSLNLHAPNRVVSFLSGIFIVIVMTGLDQDMMQKNLTCRTVQDAQKDMCIYGLAFFPANFLFLSLGVMLCMLCVQRGMPLPAKPDDLLTMFAVTGELGTSVLILFAIGIVAAAFSSADSALTALTTCFCIDILGMRGDGDENDVSDNSRRRKVHGCMAVIFIVCIMLFHLFNTTSLIDAIYRLCSYTYGPLLGLFAYAMFHKGTVQRIGKAAYAICVGSPLVCLALDNYVPMLTGYHFGYELLMVNGMITYIALSMVAARNKVKNTK